MFIATIKILAYIASVFVPHAILISIFYIYYRYLKKITPKKGDYKYIGYGNFWKRVFIDFPKRYALDLLIREPDAFREHGVHIVAGEQGAGKSLTVTYMLLRFQKMYPHLRVKTNYNYAFEDDAITHWKDIVSSNNGIYGEINVIDEIQNWFNSLQSKDFPPEMMQEITQQRKQRKIILGTSQVFSRVAKPIREQTTFLYEPVTLFGCITFVKVYKHCASADGLTDTKKIRQLFFFVHTDDLRNSYDTYKKIEKYKEDGFKDESIQLSSKTPNIFHTENK